MVIIPNNNEEISYTSALEDEKKLLDDVIREANFPDDYDLFDDELLDMIP